MSNEAAQIDKYVTMNTRDHTEVVAIATRVFTEYPALLWSDETREAVALWARIVRSDGALVTLTASKWQSVFDALTQVQFTEAQGGVTEDELAEVDALRRAIIGALV